MKSNSNSNNNNPITNNNNNFIGHFGVSKSAIQEGKHLGSGASGEVFQGIWKSLDVAVKKLKMGKMSESNSRAFKNEANLMFHLRHPHIVSLMGFVDEEPYMLIMEFIEKGNLSDFLKSTNPDLDWLLKKQFAFQIAQGMLYLHDLNILHRDLKSLNVLLNKHLEIKLSDFGLASLKKEITEQSNTNSSGGATGTFAWMAPELFNGEKNSKESDIYSFGIVCFEMTVHRLPWQKIPPAQIITHVTQGKREEIPKETPKEFKALIELCWNQNALKRKSFEELIGIIQKINVLGTYNSNPKLEDE